MILLSENFHCSYAFIRRLPKPVFQVILLRRPFNLSNFHAFRNHINTLHYQTLLATPFLTITVNPFPTLMFMFTHFRTFAFPNSRTSSLCLGHWSLGHCLLITWPLLPRLQPSCRGNFHGVFGPEMFRITPFEIFLHKLIRSRPEPRKIGSRLDRPH